MLKKVIAKSLVGDVVTQIEDAILNRTYKSGDKLPSQRDLQTILGASLGTIREAVAILEQKGLIEVKKGAKGGIFIKEATTESMSESLALLIRQLKISPTELSEFRQVVEEGLIRLVIERATTLEINELSKYKKEFKACLNSGSEGYKRFLKAEIRLRKRLASIIKNQVYQIVLEPIHENIPKYTETSPSFKDLTQEAYDDWVTILTAIEEKDVETAASATKNHILRFAKYMENGISKFYEKE